MKVKIDIDVYSMTVIVVTTFEEFKKLHKKANPDLPFVTAEYGQYIYVLVSDEWGSMYDHRFVQCLSHELNHAAMCLLSYVGVKFDYHHQEPLCYLQDYLMAQVFKTINKANKTKDKAN